MKTIHKLAILPLIAGSMCVQAKPLDLIVQAPKTDHSEMFNRPQYNLPHRQKGADAQIAKLQENADFAKDVYNPNIELSALQKLGLVKGTSSKEYLIEFIRYKVKLGGKNREEAKAALDKLCELEKDSYECVQGTALYDLSSPQMKLKLQTFSMHEDHRNYVEAVKYLHDLMGVPVEHELRFRYYKMLGNIEGSENEAIRGLVGIADEIPRDTALKFAVKKTIIRFKANYYANRGIKNIDNNSKVHSAREDIIQAIKLDPNNPDAEYWTEILVYSKYYRLIDSGDASLLKNRPQESINRYQEAAKLGVKSPYAYVGLARSYALLNDEKNFLHYSALAIENSKNESISEQQRIAASLKALKADIIARKGEKFENQGNFDAAATIYRKAISFDNTNPWLAYRLSSALYSENKKEESLDAYNLLNPNAKRGPAYAHAYALSLARIGRLNEAYNILNPYANTKDEGIRNTLRRIEEELIIEKAVKLDSEGRTVEALDLIKDIDAAYAKALCGNFYDTLNDREKAIEYYKKSIQMDENQGYTKLRLAQLLIESDKKNEAYEIASSLAKSDTQLSPDNTRALGQILSDLKHDDEALEIYARAVKKYDTAVLDIEESSDMPMQTSASAYNQEDDYATAWILRNMNSILKKTGIHNEEIDKNNRKALAILDHRNDNYEDDKEFTRATRTRDEPETDWLRQSVASSAAEEYVRQNIVISGGVSYLKDSGHGGYSDNKGLISILKVNFPLFDGTATIQTDTTSLNAGTLSGGSYNDMYGSCYVNGCDDNSRHKKTGTSIAFGFDNEWLHADIGTAPKISGNKTKYTDIVGGVAVDYSIGKWTLTPSVYRRVLNNSVLSYFGDTTYFVDESGQIVPDDSGNTAIKWGAVKKNGLALSASYYLNDNEGFWGNTQFEYLKGTRVKSNTKIGAMGGYYYHYINRPNERLTISPSAMFMRYARNLGEYTYGQGGYYSPQLYLGTSLAVRYMRRYDNTSYMVEPVISLSYANKKAQSRYPLGAPMTGRIMSYMPDINDSTGSDSSFTFGGGIRGSIEQRITSNLILGAMVNAVKSDDYNPVSGMIYFRYYLRDFEGDLFMPPHGPVPYAEW